MDQTVLDEFEEVITSTLDELASHPKVLGFIDRVLNDYVPPKRNLLLIPDDRQIPFTRSRLYAKVRKFFQEASLIPSYHIVFVSHIFGACPEELSEKVPKYRVLGKWSLDADVMTRTSRLVARYLERARKIYRRKVAYVRGSYFEVVRAASALSGVNVVSVLGEGELERLKRLGFQWAKVGLRMEEAFSIFRRRILEFARAQARLSGF